MSLVVLAVEFPLVSFICVSFVLGWILIISRHFARAMVFHVGKKMLLGEFNFTSTQSTRSTNPKYTKMKFKLSTETTIPQ